MRQDETAFIIAIYIFLIIFFLSAIITLLVVTGIIKTEDPYYKKKLFAVFIVQVGMTVIGFVGIGLKKYRENSITISTDDLIKSTWAWRWSKAGQYWYTEGSFSSPKKDKIQFFATTWYDGPLGKDEPRPPLMKWESELLDIKNVIQIGNNKIQFPARLTYWLAASEKEPDAHYEIGKPINIEITLHGEMALSGQWRTTDPATEKHPSTSGGLLFAKKN